MSLPFQSSGPRGILMDDSTGSDPSGSVRRQGPRRRTLFVGGVLLGLVLGIAGALVVPGLLPEGELDCVKPERVVWSRDDSRTQFEINYAGDGSNGCAAGVVFREPAREENAG